MNYAAYVAYAAGGRGNFGLGVVLVAVAGPACWRMIAAAMSSTTSKVGELCDQASGYYFVVLAADFDLPGSAC